MFPTCIIWHACSSHDLIGNQVVCSSSLPDDKYKYLTAKTTRSLRTQDASGAEISEQNQNERCSGNIADVAIRCVAFFEMIKRLHLGEARPTFQPKKPRDYALLAAIIGFFHGFDWVNIE